jgi:acetyltransferase-like isoleucine patch superfamily enzyme
MKKLFNFLYETFLPIQYGRYKGARIGKDCRFYGVKYSTEPYLITVGDHVSATKTRFETHDGGIWCIRSEYPEIDIIKPIVIGNNVYIGYGCIILPGVTIGDNVVIGANSIVSRDIPSNSVAVGSPARVIKTLDEYKEKSLLNSDNTKRLSSKEKKEYYLKKYNII